MTPANRPKNADTEERKRQIETAVAQMLGTQGWECLVACLKHSRDEGVRKLVHKIKARDTDEVAELQGRLRAIEEFLVDDKTLCARIAEQIVGVVR